MISNLFKQRRIARPIPKPAPVYARLRGQILNLSPAEIGLLPTEQSPSVWGVLMELGYPNGVATLVCLAEGTTSLYFSGGGGIIGAGTLEAVQQASRAMLAEAEQCQDKTTLTIDFPLPPAGRVRFYWLTFTGIQTREVNEAEIIEKQHGLSALFYRGQEVITQVRIHQQTRTNGSHV